MSSNYETAQFMRKVPRSPVTPHIEALHTMAYLTGMRGSALEMFEHHLYVIAVYAHDKYRDGLPPWDREHLRIPAETRQRQGWEPGPPTKPLFPETPRLSEMAKAVGKALEVMAAGVKRVSERTPRSPESRELLSEQRYRNRIAVERAKGRDHVKAEGTRVREEIRQRGLNIP